MMFSSHIDMIMIYKYQILRNNTTNTACSFGNYAMFNRFWNIFSLFMVYKKHLAAFQLSSVLIFLTRFTKVRESSNVNPNISRNIVTSRYGSTLSKSPALGSRARTTPCIFQGSRSSCFHETTSTPPRIPCWDLHQLHEQFFYPIREFFLVSEGSFIFSSRDNNLTLGL